MLIGAKTNKDKRKRLSESRQGQRKVGISVKKGSHNNRSSSMHKQKKELRFNTDYGEHEHIYTTNVGNYTKFQKKLLPGRRRDTFDCQVTQDPLKQLVVHSTKYNPQRNLQIKGMFKGRDENEKSIPKRNKVITNNNHPFLKFIGKKNQRQKTQSPYSKAPNQQRNISQHSNGYSTSIQKQQKSSLSKKPQLLLNKDQISLRAEIRKETGLKQQHTQKLQDERGLNQEKKNGKQQQWTVKTIKKQRQDANQSIQSNQSFGLTEEEEEVFGDRFPYGFQKIKLLGRGGFSLVWLGKHIKSGRQFAIKQIITQNTHQTHIKEIWFGTMFFTLGGVPKPQFVRFPGVKNLVRLYSYEINQTDTWIFYQKCGQSLGSALYDIRSQKLYGQQKLYKIHYKPFYQAIAVKPKLLRLLILQICKALALLSQCQIVHSDLKTQNILIRYEKQGKDCELKEVKLIDYGSSFEFRNIAQFSMATPEYMPPQILNYIIHENEGQYQEQLYQQVMNDYKNPWAVDMWSLGCVILEIVVGVPLWMSLPLLVPGKQGSWLQKEGLFAVKGRLFPQIIKKQRSVNPLIEQILERDNYSKINLSGNMKKVIKAMLDLDFNRRISPQEVIIQLQKQDNQQ